MSGTLIHFPSAAQVSYSVVKLPDWFEDVSGEFRYQLRCVGGFAPVYIAQKLFHNQFVIAGGVPKMEISWQITGIRFDHWAQVNPLHIEEDKHALERGHYRHAELHTYDDDNANTLASIGADRRLT